MGFYVWESDAACENKAEEPFTQIRVSMEPPQKNHFFSELKNIQCRKCPVHPPFQITSLGLTDEMPRTVCYLCKLCEPSFREKKPKYNPIKISDIISNELPSHISGFKEYCHDVMKNVEELKSRVGRLLKTLEEDVSVYLRELSVKLSDEVRSPEVAYLDVLLNNLSAAQNDMRGDFETYFKKYSAIQKEHDDFCESLASSFLFKFMRPDFEKNLKEMFATYSGNFGKIVKEAEALFEPAKPSSAQNMEKNPLYHTFFDNSKPLAGSQSQTAQSLQKAASFSFSSPEKMPEKKNVCQVVSSQSDVVEINAFPQKMPSQDFRELLFKVNVNFGINHNISVEKLKSNGWVVSHFENYISTFEESHLKEIKNKTKRSSLSGVVCVGAIDPLQNKDVMFLCAFAPVKEALCQTRSPKKAKLIENCYWYFFKKDSFGFSSSEEISLEGGDKCFDGERLSWPFISDKNIQIKLNWRPAGFSNPIYSMMNLNLSRLKRIILYKLVHLEESNKK